jgi:general secretion pathway protein N
MRAVHTTLCLGLAANFALCANAAAQMRVAVARLSPDQSESSLAQFAAPQPQNVPQSDPAAALAGPRASVQGEPRGNPLWAIPLTSLFATRERPLFTPSRRPPPALVIGVEPARPMLVPPPAVSETPGLALIGLISGGRDGIAIFVDQATREVVRLRTNEGHSGWILRSIQGREATLEKTPFTAVLTIPSP